MTARVSVDEPVSLLLRVLDPGTGSPVPILAGSRLGATATTSRVTALEGVVPAGTPVTVALVLPAAALHRGGVERVVIVASSSGGRTAIIVLRVRS